MSGGGAILRLCSPQYICSSSILLQYMSSSYRLQEAGKLLMLVIKNQLFPQEADMTTTESTHWIIKKTIYQNNYSNLPSIMQNNHHKKALW